MTEALFDHDTQLSVDYSNVRIVNGQAGPLIAVIITGLPDPRQARSSILRSSDE
ncbi:hypothetical protein JXA88_14365 [Candidatus Fermentibacteria bacterium]|nr:hypothetical protein [Candidatus Fermentibacteria bacterium]